MKRSIPCGAHLADAVREGTPRWKQTFGVEGGIFEAFFRTEEAMRDFLLGMHGFGMLTSPAVVAAFDLSGFRRLVDLGGATGHLAIAACERYPTCGRWSSICRAIVALARGPIAHSAARERIETESGDFFADQLPDADLYAMGRILHDWNEERSVRLARRVYRSSAVRRRAADRREAAGRRWSRSARREHAVPQHAGGHRRQGTQPERIRAAAARSRICRVEGRRTGAPLDAVLAVKIRA